MKLNQRIRILVLLFAIASFTNSCACKPSPNTPSPALATSRQTEWQTQAYVAHPDWLAMNIDAKPLEQLRLQLEHLGGVPLKSRGESHITVLTPPEYAQIKAKLSMPDLDAKANQLDIQHTSWKPLCVARAVDSKDTKKVVYYLVVEAEGLRSLRHELQTLFVKNGGESSSFDDTHFYPHITIGFTDRDLFEADGVIKDTRNCVFDLTTATGETLTHWNQ